MRKEDNGFFSTAEQEGYQLFKQKCALCHAEPLFTDGSFKNNGLAPSSVNDLGLYTATLNATDRYKFKVPSLRNLRYTAPYMHDGRYLSLSAVLEHYTSQLQLTQNIDPLLTQNGKLGIALTATDKTNILAFLNTLNDENFINNSMLAEQ